MQVVDLKAPVAAAQQAGDNPVSKALEGINALIDKVPELWAKIKDKKAAKNAETEEAEAE